ncbi:MAG: hypothetical protein CM1200mP22_17820 [Dehalococcoidia bacterium]|nr:MAG: hypothetical protein CM1200mP22_17820 [Dehalococcoidia bacterium]
MEPSTAFWIYPLQANSTVGRVGVGTDRPTGDCSKGLRYGFLEQSCAGRGLNGRGPDHGATNCGNAPLAVQTFKELAYRGLNMSNQDISALTYQMYDALLLTEDSKEGPKAFAEKRKPQWKGR